MTQVLGLFGCIDCLFAVSNKQIGPFLAGEGLGPSVHHSRVSWSLCSRLVRNPVLRLLQIPGRKRDCSAASDEVQLFFWSLECRRYGRPERKLDGGFMFLLIFVFDFKGSFCAFWKRSQATTLIGMTSSKVLTERFGHTANKQKKLSNLEAVITDESALMSGALGACSLSPLELYFSTKGSGTSRWWEFPGRFSCLGMKPSQPFLEQLYLPLNSKKATPSKILSNKVNFI